LLWARKQLQLLRRRVIRTHTAAGRALGGASEPRRGEGRGELKARVGWLASAQRLLTACLLARRPQSWQPTSQPVRVSLCRSWLVPLFQASVLSILSAAAAAAATNAKALFSSLPPSPLPPICLPIGSGGRVSCHVERMAA